MRFFLPLLVAFGSLIPLVASWAATPNWPRNAKNSIDYTESGVELVRIAMQQANAAQSAEVVTDEMKDEICGVFLSAVIAEPSSENWENYGMSLLQSGKDKWAVAAYTNALLFNPFSLGARQSLKQIIPVFRTSTNKPMINKILRPWDGNLFLATSSSLQQAGVAISENGAQHAPKSKGLSTQLLWAAARKAGDRAGRVWMDFATSIYEPVMRFSQTQSELRTPAMPTEKEVKKQKKSLQKRLNHLVRLSFARANERVPGILGEKNGERLTLLERQQQKEKKKKGKQEEEVQKWMETGHSPWFRPLMEKEWVSNMGDHFVNGYILNALGRHREASIYLRYAVKHEAKEPWFVMEYAFALGNSGRRAEAKELLDALYEGWDMSKVDFLSKQRTKIPSNVAALAPISKRGLVEKKPKRSEVDALAPILDDLSEPGRVAAVKAVGSAWERRMAEYMEVHDSVVAKLMEGEVAKGTDFVIATVGAGSGVGSRILALASSFLVALLTNRVMLVNWVDDGTLTMGKLLRMPETSTTWELIEAMDPESEDHLVDPERLFADSEGFEFFRESERQDRLDDLVCQDLAKMFKRKFVHIHTDLNLVALLQENPTYETALNDWFGGASPLGAIVKSLIRPSPEVALEAARLLEKLGEGGEGSGKKAGKGARHLGIHLRGGSSIGELDKLDPDLLEEKTFDLAGAATECLPTALAAKKGKKKQKAAPFIYLATDNEAIRSAMVKNIAAVPRMPEVVYQEHTPERSTLKGSQRSMVDLWVLSYSRTIIRGGRGGTSAFTTVAHALSPSRALSFVVLRCPKLSEPCHADRDPTARIGAKASQLNKGAGVTCNSGLSHFLSEWAVRPKLAPECDDFA